MNKFFNLSYLSNIKNYQSFYIYTVLLSYFFLWDIHYKSLTFKYTIFLTFFFIVLKKVKINQLKYSFYLLFFLIIHLLINKIFFDMPLTTDNAKGVILIFTSFIFISIFKDKIFEKLDILYLYFPILFVPFALITLKHDSVYYEILDFKCSFFMYNSDNFNKVFLENSHYGMILPSLIVYNLYKLSKENKSILKNPIRYFSFFLIVVSSFLFGSTTSTFGLIVSIIFLFLLIKQYNVYFISSLVIFLLSYSFIFNSKNACNSKISDLKVYMQQVEIQKDNFKQNDNLKNQYDSINNQINKNEEDIKLLSSNILDDLTSEEIDINQLQELFSFNDIDLIKKNLESNYSISNPTILEQFEKPLELILINNEAKEKLDNLKEDIKINEDYMEQNFNIVNVSTQVIIKSITTSFKSFFDNPIGYGVNSYEFAYFKYNTTDVKTSFFGPDTFFINYNDAASNFPKMLTEFGIFNLFIIFLFLYLIFNSRIKLDYKILILPLVITLNIRAAGYFNSGYILCIILTFFLVMDKKNDYIK